MDSSLLVLMNNKPCVLTCSMKVQRSILLIRAMEYMHFDKIELTWWILELDEHEGCFEDFLLLLSLRIYCEEPSITLHPLSLMHTDFKMQNYQHVFSSSSSFKELSCFSLWLNSMFWPTKMWIFVLYDCLCFMSQGTKMTYFEALVFMSFVPKIQMHNFHVLGFLKIVMVWLEL